MNAMYLVIIYLVIIFFVIVMFMSSRRCPACGKSTTFKKSGKPRQSAKSVYSMEYFYSCGHCGYSAWLPKHHQWTGGSEGGGGGGGAGDGGCGGDGGC